MNPIRHSGRGVRTCSLSTSRPEWQNVGEVERKQNQPAVRGEGIRKLLQILMSNGTQRAETRLDLRESSFATRVARRWNRTDLRMTPELLRGGRVIRGHTQLRKRETGDDLV